MPRVAVKSEMIKWAIKRCGLSEEELRAKFPKLDSWRNGDQQPTFRQLESFARTTMTPFGAMFLEAPPDEKLPVPDFRTRNDVPLSRYSPNLLDTIQAMQRRQVWLHDWLVNDGTEPLDFVGTAAPSDNFKSLAQRIRIRLDLDADWATALVNWEEALQTLRKAIERTGIFVFSNSVVGLNNHRPLDPEEFRGFVLCDSVAPVIFVNDADTKSARIFTLAHELVHVWLGKDAVFNLDKLMPSRDDTERFCNSVAAEFLIPAYKLTERWEEASQTEKPFHSLARSFKVSPVVAARSALDLKYITKSEFFAFYEKDREEWLRRKKEDRSKSSGGNFYATQNVRLGRRFSTAIARAVREGRILYEDAFTLTDMKGATFHKYTEIVLRKARDERE